MTSGRETVRVRMAPSPTGHWHLGGVRTALFNWLYARQQNGKFVLRIEDTDKERSRQEYEIEIIETLKWLGLGWDEGPDLKKENGKIALRSRGDYGPYRQSERTEIYRGYLERLLKEGKAYYCYCSKEDLEAERQSMLAAGLPPKYSGRCRNLDKPPAGKNPEVIRFRLPETKMEFKDLIRGSVSFDSSLFGDIIIAKSTDSPLYNFAVVVDDELMKITHVLRGEEHISNTFKQIAFQRALGFHEPVYGHLSLILSPDKGKLSKRYTEASVLKYRQDGYLPEAMLNFLALLGWHPREDREVLTLDELIKEFDLKKIQKSGAILNIEKLDWLNAQHLKKLSNEEILYRIRPFLSEKGIEADEKFVNKIIGAERERIRTLKDFFYLSDFFFKLPDYEANLLIWKNETAPCVRDALERSLGIIRKIGKDDFQKEKLSSALEYLVGEHGKGIVFWPLRVAVSGKSASPDPLTIMEILGKEESERRIEIALKKINSLIV